MNLLLIIELTTTIIEDMNKSMEMDFYYDLSNDAMVGEGEYVMPLHTDDLAETFAALMGYEDREEMHRDHIAHLADLYL